MTKFSRVIAGLAALTIAAGVAGLAGFRIGTGHWPGTAGQPLRSETASSPATSENHHAMHEPAGPELSRQDDLKRTGTSVTSTPGTSPALPSIERKPLYYRNPMGLPDTSPVPKKDWMGMDYIAVFEGDEPADPSTIKVSLDKVQRAGVRTEAASIRSLARPIRAPAVAKPDERTLRSITLRFDGFIEKLDANVKGQTVTKGETLFSVYSPEVASAVIDYRRQLATAGSRSRDDAAQYVKAVSQRFRNLGLPENVLAELRADGAVPDRIAWPSPASGTVIEKKVVEGQMIRAGDELYRLADLGSIWVIADVAEQDIAKVAIGLPAKVRFRALPDRAFDGQVTFVLHELEMATRTAKVRIEVKNPDHLIKHEMFAEADIDAASGDAKRLVVPASAIIDSGNRQVVIVDKGEGRFQQREVELGVRAEGVVEIHKGLEAGEKVVVAANFLLDAESNIKAALDAFAPDAAKETAP
ncbi:MAG: efflux RND transporter periplasmic adaptor subunit [Hyphomicrobium sp.]